MDNFPNMIHKDVDVLLESELQMIPLENDARRLEKKQLTSQLNEQTKLFETKVQTVQQLRHELQVYESEKVHAERLVTESNALSGWQPFPEFLIKKNANINIKTNNERCFGFALLYFLKRANLSKRIASESIVTQIKCFNAFISTLSRTK